MEEENPVEDDDQEWIGGDGGPLIVLQSSAVPHWQGASDFDNSLMGGGEVETDYDVICRAGEYVINRHGRDMLILEDSEWEGRLFLLTTGAAAVVQPQGALPDIAEILDQVSRSEPDKSWPFHVQDDRLRLLVGADDGEASLYGCSEISVTPGFKRCDLYSHEGGLILLLSASEGGPSAVQG